MPATRSRRWTAPEVRSLIARTPRYGPRYELIDGELLVSPAPRLAHQRVIAWLAFRLTEYALAEPIGEVLTSPADLELVPGTIAQPDLFVVPGGAQRARTWVDVTRIVLAVEVISRATARNDRGPKREHYMRAGVDEYWIVDPDAQRVERWRPGDAHHEIATSRLAWHPSAAQAPLVLTLAPMWDLAR